MKRIATILLMLVAVAVTAQETVTIGTQVWMKQNLNVGIQVTSATPQVNNGVLEKWCYNNSPSQCIKFGGLYQFGEAFNYDTSAKGICPDGFHIPTYDEWMVLINYAGGTEQAGKALNIATPGYWLPYATQTNSTGFSAVGNGYGKPGGFGLLGNASYWWTSSEKPINTLEWYDVNYPNATTVCPIYITGNYYPAIKANPFDINKNWAFAVRCIQN